MSMFKSCLHGLRVTVTITGLWSLTRKHVTPPHSSAEPAEAYASSSQYDYRGLPCQTIIHGPARGFLLRRVKTQHELYCKSNTYNRQWR